MLCPTKCTEWEGTAAATLRATSLKYSTNLGGFTANITTGVVVGGLEQSPAVSDVIQWDLW